MELSLATATYSSFLGDGDRTWLNPYLGLRGGYAWQGASKLLVGADLGLELYSGDVLIVETSARPQAHIGPGQASTSVALGGSLLLPF